MFQFTFLPIATMFEDRNTNVMAFTTVTTLFASMLVYGAQKLESMLLYPSNIPEGSRTNVDTPDKYNLPYKKVELKTVDNETLQAYILTVCICFV